MKGAFFKFGFCICVVQSCLGLPSLSCDPIDPILPSTVKCSCQNVGAPGISWYRGGVFITPCTLLGGLCFSSMGYTFTVDVTTSTYTIEFGSYTYTECTNVTCSDSTTPSDSDLKHISVDVANYSSTITVNNEPASSHMNGNIVFTTDCIYKANSSYINATTKWKAVVNETETDELDIDEKISKTGSCQFCTDDSASKFVISFTHQEEQSDSRIKAKIRLLLYIDGITDPFRSTTKNEYYVKVRSGHTSKPWCCFDEIWCIIIFVVVVLAISYIPAVVIRCNEKRFYKVIEGCNLCILIIPCVGLILIIIYCCLLCKGCCRKNAGCCRKNKVKPRTPIDFTYDESSVTINSFKVRWKSVSDGRSGLKFLLVWSTGNENVKSEYIPYENINDMEYMITDLNKATNYDVRICAEINGDKSEFTEILTVQTLVKPRTPKHLTYDESSVTINSFKVLWTSASNGESGLKFLLVWSTGNEKEKTKYIPYENINDMEYIITGLKESTTYNVTICAEVNNVTSNFADSLEVVTEDGMLTKCTKQHQRIADKDEICCEKCKEKGYSRAAHAYCLSHKLYLCLYCLDKKHTNKTCVRLWNTGDIDRKDHKLCCNENYNHDDLQLKGVCQTCKLFFCSQCIVKHDHTDCTSHQQLHGPRNTMARICCQQNKTLGGTETVDFCIQCKKFVCLLCLKLHDKHIVISSVIDFDDGKTALCCQLNDEARGNESVDFCIQCKTFVCASCLKGHNNHVVISALTGLISTRVGMCCNLKKNNEIRQFCIQCQTFVCDPCNTKHNRHFIVPSIMALSKKEFSCKGCPSAKRNPIECLALHKGVFLCASCYETGNLKKALKNKRDSQEPIVENFTKNQNGCQVHGVLGNVRDLKVEVYCIVCQLYMCLGCFKKHRRIYEHWSKTLEGNLFYCNRCQTGELNPVECCDFTSLNPEFKCGNCYIFTIPSETEMAYAEEVKSKMENLRSMNIKCQVHEDGTKSSTAAVYCLVCKTTMCKSCFKEHLKFEK